MKDTKDTVIGVRLSDTQMQMLRSVCEATGLSAAELFRQLLENATIRPAVIRTEAPEKEQAR